MGLVTLPWGWYVAADVVLPSLLTVVRIPQESPGAFLSLRQAVDKSIWCDNMLFILT